MEMKLAYYCRAQTYARGCTILKGFVLLLYVVYIAGKKKGQSKYTPCSGEWTEAKLDGYKR